MKKVLSRLKEKGEKLTILKFTTLCSGVITCTLAIAANDDGQLTMKL